VKPLRGLPEFRLATWGFLPNAAWEFAQSPLYTDHERGFIYVLWTRLHCTGGDVLILLGSFWAVSLLDRTRSWYTLRSPVPALLFVGLGLAYTLWSEWFNPQVTTAWEYAPAMPTLFSIGLMPILQWLILPSLLLCILRRNPG
jgi:hypothetical protein